MVDVVLCLASVVLFLTGVGKLIAAGGSARILTQPDPLLGVANKFLIMGVGLIEVVAAGYLLFGARSILKGWVVTWLAGNFGLYKIGLAMMGSPKPCGCLGSISDALGMSARTAALVSNVALGYLLFAGVTSLLLLRRANAQGVECNESAAEESVGAV